MTTPNNKPLPIDSLYVEKQMLGMGYMGLKDASLKDGDALYLAIVELGDEPEAPKDDYNGGRGIEFFGTNINYIPKEDIYNEYVKQFNKLK